LDAMRLNWSQKPTYSWARDTNKSCHNIICENLSITSGKRKDGP